MYSVDFMQKKTKLNVTFVTLTEEEYIYTLYDEIK